MCIDHCHDSENFYIIDKSKNKDGNGEGFIDCYKKRPQKELKVLCFGTFVVVIFYCINIHLSQKQFQM